MTSLVCSYRKRSSLTQGQGEGRTDHLLSARSVLFPTSMMMTSLPLSVRTSSIHFVVCWKEFTSKKVNRKSVVSFLGRLLKECEVNILENDVNILFPLNETNTGNTLSRFQLLHWHNQPTCDIVNYDCSSRVSDVTWNEASKSLLPRCVPQLQPDLWSSG